uniref:Uncharacterized protein n=1 Tax=Ignisphaera aggregans TaxID=334771 RepID=A0A7C2ZP17_9CREN
MRTILRKGASEAVGAVIAFTILSLTMLYIIMNLLSLSVTVGEVSSVPTDYLSEKLVPYYSGNTLVVKNVGSTISRISYVVIVDSNLNKYIVNANQSDICSISPSTTLAPGSYAQIACTGYYTAVAIVTRSGRVFAVDPELYAVILERQRGIPMQSVYSGIMFTSTSGILRFLENKTMMVSGAINTAVRMDLRINSSGAIEADLNASLVIIGKNPSNNKLNLLVVGRGTPGSYINVSGSVLELDRDAVYRYRLKIENFTGDITGARLGINPCYVNTGSFCRIQMDGQADRIVLYSASSVLEDTVGLDPYVFVGDLDNNGNTEIVFVTQDFTTGKSSSVNDRLSMDSQNVYVDSSAMPIRIVFTETPIDSSKYSYAILSIRLFFWDNSEDDIKDNDNRVVLRAGIYSSQNGTFAYSTYLSYYELSRYRNVKPFSTSYITKDFTVYIPNTGEKYYVAVELLDPFHNESGKNDADLILGIEYIGIALAGR